MTDAPIVYVLDDDEATRALLEALLGSVRLDVRTFGTARDFLGAYQPERPGCLVLDVRLPEISGLEFQQELRGRSIELPVIILTAYGDTQVAVRAMKGGAFDFVEKPINNQSFLEVIQKAVDHSRRYGEERRRWAEVQGRIDRLTSRERDVLEQIVAGKLNKQIAFDLSISERTVEVHRSRIMEKMRAATMADLWKMVVGIQAHAGKPWHGLGNPQFSRDAAAARTPLHAAEEAQAAFLRNKR